MEKKLVNVYFHYFDWSFERKLPVENLDIETALFVSQCKSMLEGLYSHLERYKLNEYLNAYVVEMEE